MKTIWTIIDKIWWSLLASDTLTDKLIIGNFVLFFPRSAEEHPRANSGQTNTQWLKDKYWTGEKIQVRPLSVDVGLWGWADELMRL